MSHGEALFCRSGENLHLTRLRSSQWLQRRNWDIPAAFGKAITVAATRATLPTVSCLQSSHGDDDACRPRRGDGFVAEATRLVVQDSPSS